MKQNIIATLLTSIFMINTPYAMLNEESLTHSSIIKNSLKSATTPSFSSNFSIKEDSSVDSSSNKASHRPIIGNAQNEGLTVKLTDLDSDSLSTVIEFLSPVDSLKLRLVSKDIEEEFCLKKFIIENSFRRDKNFLCENNKSSEGCKEIPRVLLNDTMGVEGFFQLAKLLRSEQTERQTLFTTNQKKIENLINQTFVPEYIIIINTLSAIVRANEISTEFLSILEQTPLLPRETALFLNFVALKGSFGFTSEKGRKYLEKRANLGDKDAQHNLNWAAARCNLGFTEETGREYLEKRANLGDKDAQTELNAAAARCNLGFTSEKGREYLEKRANLGDKDAQKQLNLTATTGNLDFTSEKGRKYLEERANLGDKDAQHNLNWAAAHCNLGFTKETGREYLEERIKSGDVDAQTELNAAAARCNLGFDKGTGKKYLEERIKSGDVDAQHNLNWAAVHGNLGFTLETGKEYLEERLKSRDVDALEKYIYAVMSLHGEGKFGFTSEEFREYLEKLAERVYPVAQSALNYAAANCKLNFNKNTGREYIIQQAYKSYDVNLLSNLSLDPQNQNVIFSILFDYAVFGLMR